ncbi:MAG: hypothetical protein NZ533_06860 [Casimicrobiaceae bacterium]|nr:hypothetical protein [Casimicrobiaceae bacterium]
MVTLDKPTPARLHIVSRAVVCAVSAVALVSLAHAGRPFATDDAAIVAAGACQVEAWTERGRDERALWVNPGCNPFGSTEFALGGARVRVDGEGRFSVLRGQVKHLFRPVSETDPGFAIAVGGSRARSVGEREWFVNGIASLPLSGEERVLHLNLGAVRTRTDGRARERLTYAAAFDTALWSGGRLALEAFGTSGERAQWQLGAKHELIPGHLQVDASVGSAFGRWSKTRRLTVGLVLVSPTVLR